MLLFFRWPEYIRLYQSYDMTDQFPVWCTLFALYSLLLLVICSESGWLCQWYGMKDQFSLWCTLFGLHFFCSARSTTKLTGRNRKHPHYLPICQGNCILFISCRDKTYFCNKDYPKRRVFSEPWSLWASKQILIARIIDRLSREAFFSANPKIWSAKSRTLKPWPCFTDASGFVVTEAEPYQADMKWIVIAAQVLPCLVYLMRWSPMQSERQ